MWKFSMRNEIRRVSVLFIMIQIYSVSFIIGIWMDIKSINLREIVTYKCYSNSSGIPCCSRLSLGHLELAENKYANMLVLLAFRNSYLKKKKKISGPFESMYYHKLEHTALLFFSETGLLFVVCLYFMCVPEAI